MADYLQVQAERRNEVCVLRITGELDASKADAFADNADAVVRTMPRPVLAPGLPTGQGLESFGV